MNLQEPYIRRCLQLAGLGAGSTSPNPMVGAILVHKGRIIGEGYHEEYGEPHAEVNCLASVKEKDKEFIPLSTLYVSLEPCAHTGKTPPCADLIIKNSISSVVVGCRDPFGQVNGKGIDKLKMAGIDVRMAKEEDSEACKDLNKRFFTFHQKQRPYIVLKWAQTEDGFTALLNPHAPDILNPARKRLFISNPITNRLVHKWRLEESSILVGTNTALMDDPQLTNRVWPGPSPIRLIVDMNLRLPPQLRIFNRQSPTIVFNAAKHNIDQADDAASLRSKGGVHYFKLGTNENLVTQLTRALFKMNILSVLVEGGARLHQSFLDEGTWDETRVITATRMNINQGRPAPEIKNATRIKEMYLLHDKVEIFQRQVL